MRRVLQYNAFVSCQTYKTEIWETKSVCLYFNFVLVFNYLILVWIVSLYKQNSHKIRAHAASNLLEIYMNISSYPGGGKWSGSGLKNDKTIIYIMIIMHIIYRVQRRSILQLFLWANFGKHLLIWKSFSQAWKNFGWARLIQWNLY